MAGMDDIRAYCAGDTRNKIIIGESCIPALHYVDVGVELAKLLQQNQASTCDYAALCRQILKTTSYSEQVDFYLALKNIGILFEPSLHLNLRTIIENYSIGQSLFISAEGCIESDKFLFMDDAACAIDLHGLSYKQLKNEQYEI